MVIFLIGCELEVVTFLYCDLEHASGEELIEPVTQWIVGELDDDRVKLVTVCELYVTVVATLDEEFDDEEIAEELL